MPRKTRTGAEVPLDQLDASMRPRPDAAENVIDRGWKEYKGKLQ